MRWNQDEQKPLAGEIEFERMAENAREAWVWAGRLTDPADCEGVAFVVETPRGDVHVELLGDQHVYAEALDTDRDGSDVIDTTDLYLTQFFAALEQTYRR